MHTLNKPRRSTRVDTRPKAPTINKETMKQRAKLRDTFFVVSHGTPGAVNIDRGPLECKELVECKDGDLPYFVNLHNKRFWHEVNWMNKGGKLNHFGLALEEIITLWTNNGFVLLSHFHPARDSHADVIIDFVMWELRKRGIDNRP